MVIRIFVMYISRSQEGFAIFYAFRPSLAYKQFIYLFIYLLLSILFIILLLLFIYLFHGVCYFSDAM